MKKLILFKKSEDSNVGHLYEHAYSLNVVNLMNNAGLLDHLDYKLEAETFESGLIKLAVLLQSSGAKKMEVAILTAKVGDKDLAIAITSVEMEEGKKLNINQDMLEANIKALNKSKWIQEDDIEIEQIEDAPQPNGAIIISSTDSERSNLRIKVTSEATDDLIPLQYFINFILQFNIERRLGNLGAYFTNNQHSLKGAKLSNVFNYYVRSSQKPEDIIESINEVVEQLSTPSFYQKIERFVKNSSNQQIISELNEDVFHVSGILVGNKGWNRILNIESFESYLNTRSIKIVLHGQEHVCKLPNA